MMKEQTEQQIKRVVKVIFAWEDEKEEKWLEEMATQGWRLQSVLPYVYYFHRGEPSNSVYRLDYKNTFDKDYTEYTNIYKESGWELVAIMGNWHYYRIDPQNDQQPEIFNSSRTKSQKYRRLLVGLVPFLPIYLVLLNPARMLFNHDKGTVSIFETALGVLWVLIIFLFIFAMIRLLIKIRKLESHSKE
jgi:hypothetical protein